MGGEYSMMDGWVVFSVSVIISCCLVLCLTDFFDDYDRLYCNQEFL